MENFVNKYGRVTAKSAKKIMPFLRWYIGKEFSTGRKVNTLACVWYENFEIYAMSTKGIVFLPRFLKYRHSTKSKWVSLEDAIKVQGFGADLSINQKVATLFFELEKQSNIHGKYSTISAGGR